MTDTIYKGGAAFIEGKFVPISEARLPVGDWGFTHSDVTYDVVHVTDGAFFRLDTHLDRFAKSLKGYRLDPGYSREEMRHILGKCVALSELQDAFVAMISTRGIPRVYGSRNPLDCDNTFIAYSVPWVDVIKPDVQARGAHLIVSETPRISPLSLDPTLKNYMWRDFTRGMFEALDKGADTAILLDQEGYLTEGAGFNVFIVKGKDVITPDRGALEGITRLSVLDICPELGLEGKIAPITYEDLMDADEVFTATTAGGVMPCSRVDGKIYGNDRPGPISTKIKDLYWQKHKDGWNMTPVNYADAENPFAVTADA